MLSTIRLFLQTFSHSKYSTQISFLYKLCEFSFITTHIIIVVLYLAGIRLAFRFLSPVLSDEVKA